MAGQHLVNKQDAAPPINDERTPLLAESQNEATNSQQHQEEGAGDGAQEIVEEVPLPTKQILLICFARFVEPIVYFSIFPFVQEMVVHVGGVPKAEVGFYSGLIESLFSLTQMILMIPWGRASDRIGRKPVLLASMCGILIFTTLFGFSKSLWQMILFRCLAGVFAGSIVTIRTMITELSNSKTQARAFSYFQFASNLGIFVGPFIGGTLADPAGQYPSAFKHVKFFNQFPYALPTIATGTICAIAVLTTALFVNETLPKKHRGSAEAGGDSSNEQLSIPQILRSPGVLMVILVYGLIFLLAFGYTAIAPVFWFTPVDLGGCGFSPLLISIFLAAGGFCQSVFGLLIFPPLQQRIGTKNILQACSFAWPILYLLHASANSLLTGGLEVLFWILAGALVIAMSALSMAFIATQLALNDAAPSPSAFATLNSVALAVMSGTRAFAPAAFTSIYAASVSNQILGGQLAWVALSLCSVPLVFLVRWIPSQANDS